MRKRLPLNLSKYLLSFFKSSSFCTISLSLSLQIILTLTSSLTSTILCKTHNLSSSSSSGISILSSTDSRIFIPLQFFIISPYSFSSPQPSIIFCNLTRLQSQSICITINFASSIHKKHKCTQSS